MDDKPGWLDLESVLPLQTTTGKRDVRQITGLSADTVKRRYPQYVKQLSPRRCGMTIRHALEIAGGV
jgi:hypothetical protein